MMNKIFCRGYRFPPEIIQRAIWFYYRFTLSLRDVEERLAERGIEVTYETIRQWGIEFGPAIARDLRSRRPRPHARWHMDEMFVLIRGKRMYLWRAVDREGEVLDCLVQPRRNSLRGWVGIVCCGSPQPTMPNALPHRSKRRFCCRQPAAAPRARRQARSDGWTFSSRPACLSRLPTSGLI